MVHPCYLGLNILSHVLLTIFITEQTVLAAPEPEPIGVSNFGKRFVVALPGQKGQRRLFVNFVLFTLEYSNFNVTLSTKWSNQSTDYNYTITNGRPAQARLSHEFVGFEKYGQKGNSYALQANYRFSCQVFLENKAHFNISAHFLALPMEGWGQWYLLLTTNSNPSVQVVNGLSEQRVQILAPIKEKSVLRNFGYQREAYGFYLLSEESWSLQLCTGKLRNSSFSGYKLKGTSPYGVITGSCFDEELYLASDPGCRPDINLDMLFPISEYATKFIVTKPVKFEGHLKIVVAKAKTQVSIDGLTISRNFTSQRDLELISFEKENMVGPHFIMSTGAITVAFFVITTCKSNSYVEIASTIFVPTGLYMDNYYWTIYKEETMKNYLLMIARTGDLEFVYINGYQMESSAKNVCTLLNYTSYQSKDRSKRKAGMWLSLDYQLLLDGYHQLYNKNGLRLSVFLYGQRDGATYIYPAGFIVPPKSLSTCGDTTSGHTEGDLIDNDCDGYIDEEERDHEDDDGDDRIDEDKGKSPLTNGLWADWKGWQCESTFATTAHRNRYCDDPPPYNGGMPCSGSDVDVLSNINCTNIESAVIVNPSRLIEAIHCHLRPDRVITAYVEWSCYDLSGYGNLRCQSHPPLYLINKDCFTCSDILRRQFNWLRYSDSDVYGNTIHSTARRTEPHTIDGKFCQSDDPAIYRNQTCYICHDYFYTAEAFRLAIPMTTTISTRTTTTTTKTSSVTTLLTPKQSQKTSNMTTSPSTSSTTAPRTTEITLPKQNVTRVTAKLLTEAKLLYGFWGDWSAWSCLPNCSVRNIVRTRPCLDPPLGPRDFNCPGFAYQLGDKTSCNEQCATNCSKGWWGFNCSKSCINCETACDKDTGSCAVCIPGYRYPSTACDQECAPFTFGRGCSGDCSSICRGKDCIDRRLGTCPVETHDWKSKIWYFIFVVCIILTVALCKLSGRRPPQKYATEEDAVINEGREVFDGL